MSTELIFIGIYDEPKQKSEFLQHIRDMKYIKVIGVITLESLEKVMLEKFSDNPELTEATKSFIDFQKENGVKGNDDIYYPEDLTEVSVIHFDVYRD